MKDENKYKLWFGRKRNLPFETRNSLVNWIHANGTTRILRITFNNKSGGKGRTGWIDERTLLELWQEVDRKRAKQEVSN